MSHLPEKPRYHSFRIAAIAMFVSLIVAAVAMRHVAWRGQSERRNSVHSLEASLPDKRESGGYVSSTTCRSCHPGEHASWHRSFHRTMTQKALSDSVVGDFDGRTIVSDRLAYRVYREGGEFWAEMPDPDAMMYVVQGGRKTSTESLPRVERRVVMTTGSHHYQTYWVESPRYPGLLQTLPLVYLIAERQWIPRESAFMVAPEDKSRFITQWNHHCIRCHSTGGNPGLDESTGMLDTEVGELGIACEACHGPGEEHIAANRDPIRRYALHVGGEPDTTIVNPARLHHEASSQVCGQCHGVYVERGEFAMKYAREGVQYRPGEDIDLTRYYIQHPASDRTEERMAELEQNREFFSQRWWDDGTILAGGREYTAMAVSKCYTVGEISCLSCHSMHDSDPVDQLTRGLEETAMCIQCHDAPRFTSEVETHTRHASESSGSNCLNCHMPFTTYALFGAIRSHQIASPNLRSSLEHGVPNACNLCHLDKTLSWTADRLAEDFGIIAPTTREVDDSVSAAVDWVLKGHAAQRAIAAWHMGWEPALEVSGQSWKAPFLAHLLNDDYGVVRHIAAKSLAGAPGFESFKFNFLSTPDERASTVIETLKQWSELGVRPDRTGPAVMMTEEGRLDRRRVLRSLAERDNRPVTIQE